MKKNDEPGHAFYDANWCIVRDVAGVNKKNMMLNNNNTEPEIITLLMQRGMMKNFNYLVVDPLSKQSVIIDPAWEIEKIDQALYETQSSLSAILVTHSHPDHIHLAVPLSVKYNCPIWMSNTEINYANFKASNLISIDETPCNIGQMTVQPIVTPGHTPGCVCYRIGDYLFTGDVLFAEGCGICPDTIAAYNMFFSLQRLKQNLEKHVKVYPGHSYGKPPGQTFGQLLRDNIYLQFSDKESFASFRLRFGQRKDKLLNFA